jgi:hypothetical protein
MFKLQILYALDLLFLTKTIINSCLDLKLLGFSLTSLQITLEINSFKKCLNYFGRSREQDITRAKTKDIINT